VKRGHMRVQFDSEVVSAATRGAPYACAVVEPSGRACEAKWSGNDKCRRARAVEPVSCVRSECRSGRYFLLGQRESIIHETTRSNRAYSLPSHNCKSTQKDGVHKGVEKEEARNYQLFVRRMCRSIHLTRHSLAIARW
jgi:hypothetical protein